MEISGFGIRYLTCAADASAKNKGRVMIAALKSEVQTRPFGGSGGIETVSKRTPIF
jgi:hypothetical protein